MADMEYLLSTVQRGSECGSVSGLLSDRNFSVVIKEMGSHYIVESGIYMSSFAAAIFVAALVIIGVLLLTLLIALTVMLESCQSSHSGVFEQVRTSDQDDYCNTFAFHAELNNLEADEFPTICKQHTLQYITKGRFLRELNLTVQVAENYFSTMTPSNDGLDVILMDVDDILEIAHNGSSALHWSNEDENMRHLAHTIVSRLLRKLQASGWSVSFFTRRSMRIKNATIASLTSAGYGEWSSLIMRSDDELLMENWEYISGRRMQLRDQGFRIASVISSRMDALQGPCLGKRNFKLASAIYYKV
ncbi:Acid phosphatase (Class B) [Cocos nucifera]|uniref:Acid phosphatase (Class B) n=1 Tax=Cocos nucifera TaxID=13894 RepID=A0A8K0I5C9_COCNU|nr:Acid phosphatase (Class B) [Cocos nucifera]